MWRGGLGGAYRLPSLSVPVQSPKMELGEHGIVGEYSVRGMNHV